MTSSLSFTRLACFISFFAVAVSVIAQYVFGLDPCPLCIAQRLTFFGIGVVLLLGCFGPPKWTIATSIPASLLVLLGLGTAGYHLWLLLLAESAACSIQVPMALGKIQEYFPSFMDKLFEGYGSCTPEDGSLEKIQAVILAFCAFTLYGLINFINMRALAKGMRAS